MSLKELHGWSHRLHLLHAGCIWNLPGDCVYYDAVRLSHYYHRYCLCFAFLFILLLCCCCFFFPFHTRSSADPPGSFNSTITQHSTISARVSAGRIRVTWAAPDCNQSENNECRTKAGAITLAGLTFLSLSFFFFFLLSFCRKKQQNRGGKKKEDGASKAGSKGVRQTQS